MPNWTQIVCLVAVLFAQATAGADILYVNGALGDDGWDGRCEQWDGGTCGPKGTIQAGIDAAAGGDEILVAPGTYCEAINFSGKAVDLHSAGGPDVTTIDATGLETSVVTCSGGEGPGSVLEGFTITGGTGTVAGSTIRGGGMYNVASSPTVTNCRFLANAATYGGGIANVSGSDPTVTDCTFDWNWVWDHGGGILSEHSSPRVTACTFHGNSGTYGGGMASRYGEPVVTDCIFIGNAASGGGGAADSVYSNAAFINCLFSANHAGHAAALYANGGAIWYEGGSLLLVNCTCSGNSAQGTYAYGGGLCATYENAVLNGCIVWDNAPDEICGDAVTVSYSDVRGGYPGAGNLDEDPVFVRDPNPGPDGYWGTEDDDFGDMHLTTGSCCIDSGDPTFVPLVATDLDGNKRTWDGDGDGAAVVDMGTYESGSYRYGDLNCDAACDAFDVDPFVLALTDPTGYAAAHPDCSALLADLNGDGLVNTFDIDPFVMRLEDR